MDLPYSDVVVVELGARIAAAACGRLLADLGAQVHVVEPRKAIGKWKWADRVSAVAGKESLLCDPGSAEDVRAVAALIERAGVVIVSTDVDGPLPDAWTAAIRRTPILCDVTACGSSGPLARLPLAEQDLQAMTGVTATTGLPEGDATASTVPVLEMSGGLYAGAAIAIALDVLRKDGAGQRIEVALFDVGINALTTFMPAHFAGLQPKRLGNGHGMAVPWNAYPTADGWVLVCSTNDAQWKRIAALVGPALAQEPRFTKLADRLTHRHEIDARIAEWSAPLPLEAAVSKLNGEGIPCGGIVTMAQLRGEANVVLRGSIVQTRDPVSGRIVQVSAPLIRFEDDGQSAGVRVPPPDSSRKAALVHARPAATARGAPSALPLAGLRVIEIGQLTTAPLAARHLASFGAEVIKVEPPGGESARFWAPLRGGTSHFFMVTNGEKRSVTLDLRAPQGLAALKALVRDADVLVENLKPGALAAMGLDADALNVLNPRLVYCAISGFGQRSAYPGRPAVDTVVQAMCGIMDATRCGGVPVKTGISIADIAGGQTGLVAILAALARRDRTGRGAVIDIAMQDIGVWMAQSAWNGAPAAPACSLEPLSVAEACTHPHTVARALIGARKDAAGRSWEVFASPMRLSRTPACTGTLIGEPQAGNIDWTPRQT
ncbi:CaiB/BaiF CoA-transferase family protein [Ramlibacter albus]|uniref:CoA transferase n=1 Tax=Ramlibacter albus TaxID=2079448 RepID=A0A923M5G8_9BURK|nr:CoA transferase [Ramlibacter albus]MBC5762932.1 CoA transferase [Ramlibacter albus]